MRNRYGVFVGLLSYGWSKEMYILERTWCEKRNG